MRNHKQKNQGKKKVKDSSNYPSVKQLENTLNLDFKYKNNPLNGIPRENVKEQVGVFSQKMKEQFEKSLNDLREFIKPFDVLNLVTWFSFYQLSVSILKPDTKKLGQFHIELLQALALQNTYEEQDFKPILPKDAAAIETLLVNLDKGFSLQRLAQINAEDETERKRNYLIESIRMNTFAVRNWGYPDQVLRITNDLFAPLDNEVKASFGVAPTGLIKMCEALIQSIQQKRNEHISRIRPVLKAKTVLEVIRRYLGAFPEIKSTEQEMLTLSSKFKSKEAFLSVLLSHNDLFISRIYEFTLDDCLSAYPDDVQPELLQQVLDNWSYEYGDLTEYPIEHIFLGNPIWTKPLIKIGEKEYSWPIPGLFFHSCLDLVEGIFSNNKALTEKYEKLRSTFLEDSVERMFKSSFPDPEVYRNLVWYCPLDKKNYETDLLILIDSYAIILEAKAGKITAPARRGAPDRLKREIKKLLFDPSVQASRLAGYLKKNLGGSVEFRTTDGRELNVNFSSVRSILTLSITIELFGTLSSKLPELVNAGFIEASDILSPSMSLADLEIVFDLLETSSEKIHYLSRRSEFEHHATYEADEIDLLVFYLNTGFNIGETEFNGESLMLYGISQKLDPYLLSKYAKYDVTVTKPRPRRTKLWDDILKRFELTKYPRWTEIAFSLLNVSIDDQLKFEKSINQLRRIVEMHWDKPNHKNTIILSNGPEQRKDLILGTVYRNLTTEKRNERLNAVATDAMNTTGIAKAVVLGFNCVKNFYPYSVLAFYQHPNE